MYIYKKEEERILKMRFKQLITALIAVSVTAAGAVVPVFAQNAVSMSYADGTLTVVSDTAYNNAKVFVAKYDKTNTLANVKSVDYAIESGTNTISVEAAENDKIMLWDMSDSKMDAICSPLVVEAEVIPENAILFDFGAADNVADGYYNVTPETVYSLNFSGDLQYGLHGTDDNGYRISSYTDGIAMQEGQNIELVTGAKDSVNSVDDDWVGVTDGMYPIRFAMEAENNTYYKVKAVLTGADQSKDATVSLYSEKRHPIITDETIKAGETKTVEFTATIQNVYYKGPKLTYQDDQLNVVVLGDNAAISSLMVVPVEHQPTLWIYTDSTGCDYDAVLPFFPLQNYGGVGQFLTKYLPEGFAMSNQGEGGLDAHDNVHWNCAKENIQAGDYVYVEYGHNHKGDGPEGYLSAIPKYYEYAHSKGAYTIYVGPIDRHNKDQYNASTNTWSSTLIGFSEAAESYVEQLIAGGADDVAFVDLNRPSLDWYEEVCETIKGIRGADIYERDATDYYFRAAKGSAVDGTHPNDAGADNCAALFFEEASKIVSAGEAQGATNSEAVQAAVLKPLVTGNRDAVPYTVSEDIVNAGKAPNSAYPDVYQPPNLPAYPTVIKNITIEDGAVVSADVLKQQAELAMDSYGIIVITVTDEAGQEKGKIYAVDQIDQTATDGIQTITNFRYDPEFTILDTDSISAVVMKAMDTGSGLEVDPENIAYSSVYVPSVVEAELITDEDGNPGEDFEYYGVAVGTDINTKNGWGSAGSSGKDTTIGYDEENDFYYVNVWADGIKDGVANNGSFYLNKLLNESIGTAGKYRFTADLRYISGAGTGLGFVIQDVMNPLWGNESLQMFEVNENGIIKINGTNVGELNPKEWTNVVYTLDMDLGKAEISIAGGDAVSVDIPNYSGTSAEVKPSSTKYLNITINKGPVDLDLANLSMQKIESSKVPDKTLTVSSADTAMGTVEIDGVSGNTYTAKMNTIATIIATAEDGYEFVEWQNEDGSNYSYVPQVGVRMHEDLNLKAVFKVGEYDPINYMLKEDFSKLSTSTLNSSGWISPNNQAGMTIVMDSELGLGNYLRYGANTASRGATKAFDTKYSDASGLVFSIDMKMEKANGDPNQISIHSGNIVYNSNNVNYGCTGGYILDIQQPKDGIVSINGNATDIPNATWVNVTAQCDFTAHTIDVTVTSLDGSTEYYSGSDLAMADTAADGISGIYFKYGKNSYGVVSFDNIKIYAISELQK